MKHSETGASFRTISLSGVATRAEDVPRIAGKLGGDTLAQKLERAIANKNTIVALTLEDRQRLLDVLEPETAFVDLRNALRIQVQKHAERQRRTEQMRQSRERLEGRDAKKTYEPEEPGREISEGAVTRCVHAKKPVRLSLAWG